MAHQNPNAYDASNAYDAPTAPPEKRGRGCFFYGCLIAGIGMALLLALVVGGGFWAYSFAKGQVEAYTDEAPAEIPIVEMSEEEVAEVEARVEALTTAIDEGKPVEKMVFTADEINALIGANEDLRGKVYIRIEEGKVTGDLAIPAEGLPGGGGRHFNASATLGVSMEDGVLIVTLEDATVKGQPLPEAFITPFRQQNFAKDLYKDPQVAEKLRQIESIEVVEDKIIITPRGGGDGAAGDAAGDATGDAAAAPADTAPAEPVTEPAGESAAAPVAEPVAEVDAGAFPPAEPAAAE
ncbi:MAG: hypothetical protein AAF790_01805 [Planctomycetota bacterium]